MKNTRLFLCGIIPLALAFAPLAAIAEVKHPHEIINRPRTNPAGQITVGGDVGLHLLPDFDGDGPGESSSSIGLGLLARYGVNDKLEVGVAYDFTMKEFEAKGDFKVEAAYGLITDGNLGFAPQVQLGYHALAEILDPISLGARVQFKINDKMQVYSGGNQLVITVDTIDVPNASIPKPIFLQIPVGFGFQASPKLYAFVDTTIAHIEIADSDTGFLFADFIPLQVGAFFSPSNTMDFGAAVSWSDLSGEIGDLSLIGSARLHM